MNYEAMPQPCTITIETEKDGFKYTYKLNALSMMLVDNSKYLDYDCSNNEECEPEGVLTKFRLFYEDIKSLFKLSRGDKLVRYMQGEDV